MAVVSDFVLLATDPAKGGRIVDPAATAAALAGAIVSDLLISGRVGRGDRGRLVVLDASLLNDPTLDRALGLVVRDEKPRSMARWISRLEDSTWRIGVLETLVARGDLRKVEHRVLGLFPSPRYPATTQAAGTIAFESMRSVLAAERPADDATAALIGLCDAAGLLRKLGLDHRAAKPYLQVDVIKAVRSSITQHRSSGDGGAAAIAATSAT